MSHSNEDSFLPQEGDVRFGGGSTDAGRVEIFLGGRWGAIPMLAGNISEHWGMEEADVVCRQLHLRKGIGVMRMPSINDISDMSAISSVRCQGNESSLATCRLSRTNTSDLKDIAIGTAGVRCSNFVIEDQPHVIINEGKSSQKELQSLLSDSRNYLSCKSYHTTSDISYSCSIDLYSHLKTSAVSGSCAQQSNDSACGMKNPFDSAFSLEAFVFEDDMAKYLKEAEASQLKAISQNATHPCSSVEMTALGFRFIDSHTTGDGDASLEALKALYLSPLARVYLDLDADITGLSGPKSMRAKELSSDARAIYTSLERDGLVRIADIGLDLLALQKAVQDALNKQDPKVTATTSGGIMATREKLPPLEEWLRNDRIVLPAISAYLGGEAILHGYKAVYLPGTMSNSSFISSLWHHDRAGHRLKLFILLNDVDDVEGHPTQVAKGSHNLVYYWQEEYAQSRYKDDYIGSNFIVERMSGLAGTGFVFDTNAIHKATAEGSQARQVVIVEFHQAAKCGIIDRLGLNVPCPSGDQRPLNWLMTSNGVKFVS